MRESLEMCEGLEGSAEALRRIIGAAMSSLLAHLSNTTDPFIVGGQYPDTKLVEAVKICLKKLNFKMDPDNPAIEPFLNMCKDGVFEGEGQDENADDSK